MNRYKELVELQSKCDYLSLKDSIHLTELLKANNSIEVAIFLLEIIEDIDTAVNIKFAQIIAGKEK
jgi:hypothetical protein